MKDKITCFKLNWYNYGERCIDDIDEENITIYRKNNRMVFRAINGYGEVCLYEIINIDENKVDSFFSFLEKNYSEWEDDYKVLVIDGSEWEMLLWHSAHKIKKIRGTCGTFKILPYIKKIEKYIHSFIADGKSIITPSLFGCSDFNSVYLI